MRLIACILLLFWGLSGCAVKDFGSSLRFKVQGEYYLQNEKYTQGVATFREALEESPANVDALFYYSRFLIETEQYDKAVPYLEKAIRLSPDNADFYFWLGVAWGELGRRDWETKNYLRALQFDPEHAMAMVNLGHNYLRSGKLEESFKLYQRALQIRPYHPQALYNRGLILKRLKREPEEKLAWKLYLDSYPAGAFARRATDRLNYLGDYSYRNHTLGFRKVTLTEISFLPFSTELSEDAKRSLNLVGATLVNMQYGTLQVLVFQKNNKHLAGERARAIRRYLYSEYPELRQNSRVRISWFSTPEKRKISGKTITVNESVKFFLTDMGTPSRKIKPTKIKKVRAM